MTRLLKLNVRSLFFALGLVLLQSGLVWAEKELPPLSIEGTTQISAEEVIGLFEAYYPTLVLIDSRKRGDREQGYIEDSLSLPNTDTTCDSLSKVIPTQATHALFYCNGVKCARSAKALNIALSCGYSKLYWFRGGFEEWVRKGFPYVND